ncbi:MAG TPA: serine/threonine-protein kinase [Polyangiaceae bacterium]|nr:serine/threonine-protein kinase [Polyangiaceae bacterium]
MSDEPAPRLGNYVLLLELASGGMATVYIGRQAGAAGFERLVVIKRVHRHLVKMPEFHDMFLDEARVASIIRHPNVVSVDDVVEADDELFLVQPYVESVSLATLIEAARLSGEHIPPSIVVRIIADALAGLSAAHEAVDIRGDRLDVVHRDVSPHNILVGTDGRSRIIDFGIAKAAKRITTTTRDVMKGKLAYMSPEQARQQPLDARADLFALGAVLHEALVGEQLFKGEDQADVLLAVLIGEIAPPSTLVPDVLPELDEVVLKALAREPEDRYQTGGDFLEHLEGALPPAQGRDVAQLIERLCGRDLEIRRSTVRDLLDQPRLSAIPRLTPLPGDASASSRSSSAGRRSQASRSDVTMAATPALNAGALATPASSARRRILFAGALLGAALLGGGVVITLSRGGPGPSYQGSERAEKSVPLVLTADAPIETVSADGLRSIDLSANLARVEVAPWSGDLTVRATLKGGASASAVVPAGGPFDVKLVTAAPPAPSPVTPPPTPAVSSASTAASPPPTASAAPSASPKGKKPDGKGPPTTHTSRPSGQPDLKPNPFLD